MRRLHTALLCLLGALLAGSAGPACAQLKLPLHGLPAAATLHRMTPLTNPGLGKGLIELQVPGDLRTLRGDQVRQLLLDHPRELAADPHGEAVVREELLAWSISARGRAAARRLGLQEVSTDAAGITVLRLTSQDEASAILDRLRQADPDGSYDFNHIYTGSGLALAGAAAATSPAGNSGPARVGLIDSGVGRTHEALSQARITSWGCNGSEHPAPHGTAVAALLVGRAERFHGVAPEAQLYAADVYCDDAAGGSAARIAQALDWLGRERVGVINISLVGPPNRILEQAVAALVKRGHLLVAAVGNDGPAAPPLYPAAYPGVVGVSGVDRYGRVLPEAARGPQVMFAAPASQMASAALGDPPYRVVRGTSFAAPIVAGLLAPQLAEPDPARAAQALNQLAASAADASAGETGRGVVGRRLRPDPDALR